MEKRSRNPRLAGVSLGLKKCGVGSGVGKARNRDLRSLACRLHISGNFTLTQDQIAEDPRDLVANYLRHAAARLSVSGEHFMAIYLLSHGIVKMFAVVTLLKNKLWGYPLSIAVFGAFIVYQIYRFLLTGGVGLIALTIFDLIVICLIWLEYRAVRSRPE